MAKAILGIDPGTRKTGFAVVSADGTIVEHGIAPTEDLLARITPVLTRHDVAAIAIGTGTHAAPVRRLLEPLGRHMELVDEHDTTYRARRLYFEHHPPRGWRRLIPLGLQLPPEPIDDFAAALIARRLIDGSR